MENCEEYAAGQEAYAPEQGDDREWLAYKETLAYIQELRDESFESNMATLVERLKLNYSEDGECLCIYREDNATKQSCANTVENTHLNLPHFQYQEEDLKEADWDPFKLWKVMAGHNFLCDQHRELSYQRCGEYHVVPGYNFSSVDVELLIRELRLRLIFEYQFGFMTDWKHEGRHLALMEGIYAKHINANNEKLDRKKMKTFICQHYEHSRCVPHAPNFYFDELLHTNTLLCPTCTVEEKVTKPPISTVNPEFVRIKGLEW